MTREGMILPVLLVTLVGEAVAQPTFIHRPVANEPTARSRSISVADVDSDGDMDVLAALCDDGHFAWYENNGETPPVFEKRFVPSDRLRRQPCHVRGVDLNGDGKTDIVGVSIVEESINLFTNIGTVEEPDFIPSLVVTDPDGWAIPPYNENSFLAGPVPGIRQIDTGDLDGDGDLDVAAASVQNDGVHWFENDGEHFPEFETHNVTLELDGARTVAIADLDGDGDNDIVAGGWFDNTVQWYENDGQPDPTFAPRVMASVSYELYSWRVHPVDLDGDGDLDVLNARARGVTFESGDVLRGGQIDWYENDGQPDPTFTARTLAAFPLVQIGKSVYSADFDLDGDIDVVSASFNDDHVAWFENDGESPPSFAIHTLAKDKDGSGFGFNGVADFARSVWAADMDNDGDKDIVWLGRESGIIAWHENTLINPPDCLGDLAPPYGQITSADSQQFEVLFNGGDRTIDLAPPFGIIGESDKLEFERLIVECAGGTCNPADLALPFFQLEFNDVIRFLELLLASDPRADFNNDTSYDFSDVTEFLDAFNQGCP